MLRNIDADVLSLNEKGLQELFLQAFFVLAVSFCCGTKNV